MGTLFKNGTIITASDMVQADVLVEGETITLIGQNLPTRGHEVVNCKGKYVMPGGIDVHTHLDLPKFGNTDSNDDSSENADGDARGDVCDSCPLDAQDDADADGLCANIDNCPQTPNHQQVDDDR